MMISSSQASNGRIIVGYPYKCRRRRLYMKVATARKILGILGSCHDP